MGFEDFHPSEIWGGDDKEEEAAPDQKIPERNGNTERREKKAVSEFFCIKVGLDR